MLEFIFVKWDRIDFIILNLINENNCMILTSSPGHDTYNKN